MTLSNDQFTEKYKIKNQTDIEMLFNYIKRTYAYGLDELKYLL